jgi:hypothetical protein
MPDDDRKFEASVSFVLITGWVIFIFFTCYSTRSATFDDFAFSLILIYTVLFSAALGIGLIVIRFFKIKKARPSFFYWFIGYLNLVVGLIGLAWFGNSEDHNIYSLLIFSTALILGTSSLAEVLFEKKSFRNKRAE